LVRSPGTDEIEFRESKGPESKISRSNCQTHWWNEEIKIASASALHDLKVLWLKTSGKYPRKWRDPLLRPECPRRGVTIFVV
jgi:hypothetical protein